LVEEEYTRSMAFLQKVNQGPASIAEKMQVLGTHYLEYFQAAPDAPRFFVVMGEMALRDEVLAKKLLEMQTAYITEIAKLIDQGISEGVLRPVDSTIVAAILKALLDGVEGLNAIRFPMEVTTYLGVGIEILMSGLARQPS
jgi:hypothetical protein